MCKAVRIAGNVMHISQLAKSMYPETKFMGFMRYESKEFWVPRTSQRKGIVIEAFAENDKEKNSAWFSVNAMIVMARTTEKDKNDDHLFQGSRLITVPASEIVQETCGHERMPFLIYPPEEAVKRVVGTYPDLWDNAPEKTRLKLQEILAKGYFVETPAEFNGRKWYPWVLNHPWLPKLEVKHV